MHRHHPRNENGIENGKGKILAFDDVSTNVQLFFIAKLRDLRHDNICAFIGACTDPPNICILTEYCTRGSLKV